MTYVYRVAKKKRSQTKGTPYRQIGFKIATFAFIIFSLVQIFAFQLNLSKKGKLGEIQRTIKKSTFYHFTGNDFRCFLIENKKR